MSIKLYNGYRIVLKEGHTFDIISWQKILHTLRDKITATAKKRLQEDFNVRTVYALDRDTVGLQRSYPDKSPLGAAYAAVRADCDAVNGGQRRPTFDTGVEICWLVTEGAILVLLFTEDRGLRDWVIQDLELEDFHYQNQVDPPEDVPEDEFEERGSIWEEAFGDWNNAPTARFHTFTLCDSPKGPPFMMDVPKTPKYHLRMPMEKRAEEIAFDVLFQESKEDAAGQDLIAKVYEVQRQAKEGGSLHARLLELQAEVAEKLIPEPTWEDYRRKPPLAEPEPEEPEDFGDEDDDEEEV